MKIKYVFILIIAIGLICYINALWAEFVWDDFLLVVNNPLIKSFNNFKTIFTSELSPKFDYYRPLQTLAYLLDYHLYNLKAWGFHLTNIIIHILNALLVFLIFKIITKNLFISLAGALLYVCAPIHTEAVTFISGRADLLLACFSLLAFLFYIKERYISSLLFFILSLLSKEEAMIFPLILIVYDLCFKRQIIKKKLKIYSLFFLFNILYVILRLSVFNFSQKPVFFRKIYFSPQINIFSRFLTFLKSILVYLKIIVLPVNLHMERKMEVTKNIFDPYVIAFLIGFILCFYLVFKFVKRRNFILFGLGWFFITLIPQSSFIFPLILAEHFLYLPCIGIFLIAGIFLERMRQRKKSFTFILLSIWILFYSSLTIIHNSNWVNPLRFYRWTLKFSPYSHKVHYALGNYYVQYGMFELALKEYRKAIEIDKNFQSSELNPDYIENIYKKDSLLLSFIHHNIGVILSQKGLLDDAEQEYKKSIALNSRLIEAYNDLGCLYIKQGKFLEAQNILNEALKINPNFEKAYYNLGVIYAEKKEFKKAISFWKKALEVNPNYIVAGEGIKRLKHGE